MHTRAIVPFAAIAIIMAALPGFAAGENLLSNPDLSVITEIGAPADWLQRDDFTTVRVDPDEHPHTAERSIRVTVDEAQEGLHSQLMQSVEPVKQDTLYVLSGWLKGEVPEAAYLQVKLYDVVDGRPDEIRRITAGRCTEEWRRVRIEFSSGEAERLTVLARIDGAAAGAGAGFHFADISLHEKIIHAIDLTGVEGESPDLLPRVIEHLPETEREGRFDVAQAPVLGIRNFGEGTKLVLAQAFDVTPGRAHRMTFETRGMGQFEIEWATDKGLARRSGDELRPRPFSFMTKPAEEWRRYECVVPNFAAERIWLNVYVRYATVWGMTDFRDLRVTPIDPPAADRPIALTPDETLVVEHLRPDDSRGLRGFVGAPIDGTVRSRHYGYGMYEYGDGYAGQAVYYNYNAFDGLHLQFDEPTNFNYVALRGGAYTRMYRGPTTYDRPGDAPVLWEFMYQPTLTTGNLRDSRQYTGLAHSAWFDQPVSAEGVSFFDSAGGSLADIGFYRVREEAAGAGELWTLTADEVTLPEPESPYDVRNYRAALDQRENGQPQRLLAMQEGAEGAQLQLQAGERMRFFSPPVDERFGLSSLTLDLTVAAPAESFRLMSTVHDPIDPRRDLHCVVYEVPGPGRYRVNLDFADQIVEAGRRLWLTLETDADRTLQSASANLHTVPPGEALEEALAWRKLIMKCLYLRISEPRAWMRWKNGRTRMEVFEHYGPGTGRYLAELFATIDDCWAMAPEDDEVRQYREWCYSGAMGDERSTPSDPEQPAADVPAWAHYARMGWLQMRDIARRWLDQRIVPTGEFGGRVNDDSCFYQQLTDFPGLRADGITPAMRDGATRFNDLIHHKTLRHGVNYNDMDPLHAYEEGMNHLTLMAKWYYGDPIYVENLMESARSVENLTVRTEDGRRHFRRAKQGAPDAVTPRSLDHDGGWRAMTMHTVAQLADYNRSPRALSLATEWADTWLQYQTPGEYATTVDVETGEVVNAGEDEPLSGYAQKDLHLWLSEMTGDARFVAPLTDALQTDSPHRTVVGEAADLYNLGVLDDFEDTRLTALAEQSNPLRSYLDGDPEPLGEAILGTPEGSWGRFLSSLYHVQRWPDMMDPGKQYTDRVWFRMMGPVARTYLGGVTKRNDIYPGQAVTWEGFGEDYAAAVLVNRPDRLRALVYNFREEPMTGAMRVWRLRHGRYEVTVGPDADGDHAMDEATSTRALELAKADRVPVELAPRSVTVMEAQQVEALDSIFTRADLAVAGRETAVNDGSVQAVLHNIGSAPAEDVVVAVLGPAGEQLGRAAVETIEAPLDLQPRRVPVTIEVEDLPDGWQVAVDPQNAIPEIYEGNNVAAP
jgi:hypothetical protein